MDELKKYYERLFAQWSRFFTDEKYPIVRQSIVIGTLLLLAGTWSAAANVYSPAKATSRQPLQITSTSSITPAAVDTKQATVYVTRTGKKYHRAGCRHLSKSKIPMSLSDAQRSYSPCSVCSPPR